ncbi:hypothetical protein F4703DRAFT_1927667 [Phycomyces blakesleeanus]|uniref:Phytanoyl-CoA dioxygenase family protein n=1 Tax=Phycomyces blakesleeanus (strain ATCC 8743b / DSM 1359 / FGSC 10004 / NBRC 33097 / NRRL 1555) TaxID=763407 RepID=A0A162TPY2_PHYB8|nr:hypothetical protein PHYBLDRAFT_149869 [Phycomyces blakesleeanus NRRL 1555(-)]OAD68863.1 hypothetical protein PHYBLDRAFT_149869 [Phycomyces blakesleeanus NRRL 1555(-)]|eukprot:XP_018286903.1 hypothetical protein PHYBLDRAFT_149869 [Phycomyces blakesleeanus NRRL 1555(-)]
MDNELGYSICSSKSSIHVTQEDIDHYQLHGYVVLTRGLTRSQLNALHEEADILTNHLITEQVDLVHDLGCIIEPLTCGYLDPPSTLDYKIHSAEYRKRRNAILETNDETSPATIVLETIARLAAELICPDNPKTLNEQYIIKPPQTASYSQFAWHRDSDYLDPSLQNESSVACWTALDPVNCKNGSLLLGDIKDNGSGKGNGVSLDLPAGSIVFMSNRLLHKSTGNASALFRRVFMPQYSLKPFYDTEKAGYVGLAIKCSF